MNMDTNSELNNSSASNKVTVYRFKFTDEVNSAITAFAKIHQYDDRHDYKDAWKTWMEDNKDLVEDETRRLKEIGYDKDIEDKMFKSPDILEDEEEELRNREMKRAMRNLSQREINIINGYFGIDGEPMTLEMIGEEVGLTKERVRQIKESAIRKVRNNLGGIFDI